MINNRHGPHPAVSYYRSGAPPGCDVACNDNRLYEVEWERYVKTVRVAAHDRYRGQVRGAPGPHRIRYDDFVYSLYERNQHKKENSYPRSFGKDTEKILWFQPFAALCDCFALDYYWDEAVKRTSEMVMT